MRLNASLGPPPEALPPAEGEVRVFLASLDAPEHRRMQWANTLSADEQERAARFRFLRDRHRFIAGRGLLREILGRLTGVEPDRLTFGYGPHGKPFLADATQGQGLHFNLAHSGSIMVLAVAWHQEVGVDIEKIRFIPDAERVAAQFFSKQEYLTWRLLPVEERQEVFFKCWTRKEALAKAIGCGLGEELKQSKMSVLHDQLPSEQCTANGDSMPPAGWYIQSLRLFSNHAVALACKYPWTCMTCLC